MTAAAMALSVSWVAGSSAGSFEVKRKCTIGAEKTARAKVAGMVRAAGTSRPRTYSRRTVAVSPSWTAAETRG